MLFISHRGNINKVEPFKENTPQQIDKALNMGYQVEVDIQLENGIIYLGHNRFPRTKIDLEYLLSNQADLWCHAKTIPTLLFLLNHELHTFFHETDKVTLTSKGIIWTFPGEFVTSRSVIVNNEPKITKYPRKIYGVCSDYIELWRNNG